MRKTGLPISLLQEKSKVFTHVVDSVPISWEDSVDGFLISFLHVWGGGGGG